MSETPQDPMRLAQANMRNPQIKRFYQEATVGEAEGGFALLLDGRGARTPAKHRLVVPSRPIAEWIAGEWAAQGEIVSPASMPVTRLANSAIAGVARDLGAGLFHCPRDAVDCGIGEPRHRHRGG